MAGTRAPESILRAYAQLVIDQRQGTIGMIPAKPDGIAAPTDQEVSDFYKAHIARYSLPERRALDTVLGFSCGALPTAFTGRPASEHGRFVLVSSSQAQAPAGTNASYGATKAAAESLTLALADSFRAAESMATANILVINAIVTPQMRAADPEKPYRTFTSAEDIAEGIHFLCSDGAQKMNGKRLPLYP